MEERIEVTRAIGFDGVGDLVLKHVLVAGLLDLSNDADGNREVRSLQSGEGGGVGSRLVTLVMDDDSALDGIVFVSKIDDFGNAVIQNDPLELTCRSECQRLSVFKDQGRFEPGLAILNFGEDAVVENWAIL